MTDKLKSREIFVCPVKLSFLLCKLQFERSGVCFKSRLGPIMTFFHAPWHCGGFRFTLILLATMFANE